jgi:hypothetical protein
VAKEQGVFLDRSGQGISEHSLDVGNEVLVASENPIEEFQPLWTGFPGADGRHFGNEVPPLVRADLAGLQINGAGRGIEQPRVPIPVTRLRCVLTVCPGKPLDGGNRPITEKAFRCLRIPSQEGWYRPTIEALRTAPMEDGRRPIRMRYSGLAVVRDEPPIQAR